MSGLELNKIAAGVLVAGLLAMISGKVADGLYHPVHDIEKRGFSVEVPDAPAAGGEVVKEQPANVLPLLASADVAAGEAITKRCQACHTFEKGGPNKVGPNLYGIVGAKVAHKGDFTYSEAVASHGGNWGYNDLAEFIKKPKAYLPGTKMAFAGLSKEQDRANLIAYLRTLSDSPKALPSDAEIKASIPADAPADPAASAATGEKTAKVDEGKAAKEKADAAIKPGAGAKAPKGKTENDPQAKELKASKSE